MNVSREETQEKLDRHREGAVAIWRDQNYTVPACFEDRVRRFPTRPCLIHDDQTHTFADVDKASRSYAAIAKNLGLGQGDAGAVMVENRPEFFYSWLGLTRIGALAGLLNTNARDRALTHAIACTGASVLFVGAECIDQVVELDDLPDDLTIVLIPDGDNAPAAADYAGIAGRTYDIDALAADADAEQDFAAMREGLDNLQTCFYVFTSGTTGLPKAALISHARWLSAGAGWNALCGFNENDVFYCALPLFHGAALQSLFSTALLAGGATVVRRKFSVSRFWPEVHRYGITVFQYVGEVCRYLVNAEAGPVTEPHSLKVLMGSGMGVDVWRRFQQRFGEDIQILEGWGSTESNGNLINVDNKPGSCGRIPYFERTHLRLLAYDRATDELIKTSDGYYVACGPGEVGEICGQIHTGDGQPLGPFEGYTNAEATEKKILRDVFETGDAWYRSGDLLQFDEDGYFYFVDRIGDTFRWKAENVSTAEVEQLLSEYDDAETITVYGVEVADHEGRAPMAAIQLRPGHSFDPKRLYDIASRLLPHYAVPLFIRLLEQADMTDTYKLRKVQLREQAFHPAWVSDSLYVLDSDAATYTPIHAAPIEKMGIDSTTVAWQETTHG